MYQREIVHTYSFSSVASLTSSTTFALKSLDEICLILGPFTVHFIVKGFFFWVDLRNLTCVRREHHVIVFRLRISLGGRPVSCVIIRERWKVFWKPVFALISLRDNPVCTRYSTTRSTLNFHK